MPGTSADLITFNSADGEEVDLVVFLISVLYQIFEYGVCKDAFKVWAELNMHIGPTQKSKNQNPKLAHLHTVFILFVFCFWICNGFDRVGQLIWNFATKIW